MRRPSVLLADDHRIVSEGLKSLLADDFELVGIDIREHWCRAATEDRLDRRVEREGRGDHLVARADVQRVQGEDERVRAVGNAEGMRNAEISGGLLFKGMNVRAEDEPPRLENRGERVLQLVRERRVLRPYVNERDLRHGGPV